MDFYSKALRIEDKIISLQLWDTAGQERFQSVTKAYYRGAHGVVLMYDISQEESFIAVKSWINSIQVRVVWVVGERKGGCGVGREEGWVVGREEGWAWWGGGTEERWVWRGSVGREEEWMFGGVGLRWRCGQCRFCL